MAGFQLIAAVSIAAAIGFIPVHYLLVGRRQAKPGLGERNVKRYNLFERLLHFVLAATFVVLAATGFYASIGWGGPMHGYMLMIHTTCGATFAVAVGVMLLTWAADHGFNRADGQWLCGLGCWSTKDLPAGRFNAGEKIYFWAAGLLTVTALLSMLLSMMPFLGTAGQYLMYDVHRYSTLVLVVMTIWHAYATTCAKPGGLGAILFGYVSGAWAKQYSPLWGGKK